MSKKTNIKKLNTKNTANKTKFTRVFNAPALPPKPAIEERERTPEQTARAERYQESQLMATLAYALSMRRPHGGVGERNLLGYLLLNRPSGTRWTFDATGNLHIDQRSSKEHRTLFVAHVDTVHNDDGINKIRMTPSVWYAHGSQLGADNGAGVAMLVHMLHAGVPGHYVFTVGEECGGIGAKGLADKGWEQLTQYDRAITFDRKGTTSVISHQGWGRCCSDTFADALSAALSQGGLLYMPDDTGVYTDTAEFTGLIPECTNISVGYAREHSHEEALNILHFQELADVVLRVKWDELPTERDPAVADAPADDHWYSVSPTSSVRKDFDYRMFMDDEDLEALEALELAQSGGSLRRLVKAMTLALAYTYGGDASDFYAQTEQTCRNITDAGYAEAIQDIKSGAFTGDVLEELHTYYYAI